MTEVAGRHDADPAQAPSAGPLHGLRIIELGTLVAGPFIGRLLGDLGAEIIKVEAPGRPDPLRQWGSEHHGRSLWWAVQSRNKKCVNLDLRTEAGQELLLKLAGVSDVLTENFRPGTLEKWGLGPEELWKANERLIVARVSGYGQTGPYSSRAGFASVAEAMGGIRHINGFPDEPPPRMQISLGDSLAGMFAAQGILAALYWRDVLGGGRGQVIDVSLMEACFALLESAVPEYDQLGIVRGAGGTGLNGVVPSNLFKSRDGKWMIIAANSDNVFRRLCQALGEAHLADDPRFVDHVSRSRHQDEIESVIAAWSSKHEAADAVRLLNDAGVVCGPVYTVADIFADEQYLARDMLVACEDDEIGEYIAPGIVPKFSETPGSIRWSGAWPEGAHNREVFCELLGLSDRELEQLAFDGVV